MDDGYVQDSLTGIMAGPGWRVYAACGEVRVCVSCCLCYVASFTAYDHTSYKKWQIDIGIPCVLHWHDVLFLFEWVIAITSTSAYTTCTFFHRNLSIMQHKKSFCDAP